MKVLIGYILFIIFLSLSIIHIYWGFGGKWGFNASVPKKTNDQKIINPGLAACLIVASGLLAFGVFSLIKSGIIVVYLPRWFLNYGLGVIAAIFLLRAIGEFKYIGFFKKVTGTQFAKMDTKYYSPLCLFIAVSAILLELIN